MSIVDFEQVNVCWDADRRGKLCDARSFGFSRLCQIVFFSVHNENIREVVEVYFPNIFDLLSFSVCFCFIIQMRVIEFDGWTFFETEHSHLFGGAFHHFLEKN